MLCRNRLRIAVIIASGAVFGHMFLFAEDLTVTQNNEVSLDKKEDIVLTSEERIDGLEGQVAALADQLDIVLGPKSPITSDESSISRGRAIYIKKCQNCHGSRGRGDGPLGKVVKNIQDLSDPGMWNVSDQELFNQITDGASPMPSFKRLKKEDRWHLVNYIRTLAPKPGES